MESAAGTAPGRTGKSVGTAAPTAGTASGRTRKSVGTAASPYTAGNLNYVATGAPPDSEEHKMQF